MNFRIWDHEDKTMIYPEGEWGVDGNGELLRYNSLTDIYDHLLDRKWEFSEIIPGECEHMPSSTHYFRRYDIMYSTGMLDRNQKIIYQGDIVDIFNDLNERVRHVDVNQIGDFAICAYLIYRPACTALNFPQSLQVVGNVYENRSEKPAPTLLRVVENTDE